MPLIVKPVEAALLATGQRLQSDVAEAPETYLDFGFRLQSKVLFREALIHGAGRFNSARVQEALQDNVYPRCVVKLLCQKAQQLVSASRMTQIQISSYYPEEMPRELATGRADRDSIGRNSYSNDILCWIGLTAFRQWLQQMVVNDKTHHAPDMGFKFFKTLAAGHDAYLDAHGLADFHFTFPMSQKGVAVVENKVTALKEMAKRYAQGSAPHLSLLIDHGLTWLTENVAQQLEARHPQHPRRPLHLHPGAPGRLPLGYDGVF